MPILTSTHPAAIKRWVEFHPEIATHGDYVIDPEYLIEILCKNVGAGSESSGTGAVVYVDKLDESLRSVLNRRGKQAFGHAVRRHFKRELTVAIDPEGYYRLDVAVIGSHHDITRCLVLIHTDHPPRPH